MIVIILTSLYVVGLIGTAFIATQLHEGMANGKAKMADWYALILISIFWFLVLAYLIAVFLINRYIRH